MKYIETVMSLRQCVAKGYLSYEPGDLTVTTFDQDTGYVVIALQSTYLIHKKD